MHPQLACDLVCRNIFQDVPLERFESRTESDLPPKLCDRACE